MQKNHIPTLSKLLINQFKVEECLIDITVDPAREYIEDSLNNWLGVEDKKNLLLAAYTKKKRHNIGGPAAQIKALEKNINSSVLKLKRDIFSSPKAKANFEEELKWSREELARRKSTYVPKT